jgi:HEPN domain-containing protein
MSRQILAQADDFFNAYQILKESNLALINKLEKLAGKPLVSKTAFGSASAMGVNIVCLAFSIELYLKYLHFTLNGKVLRGHNILKLYEKLPDKIRQDIFNHEAISENPFHIRGDIFSIRKFDSSYTPYERFLDQVKAISNAFVEWRYSYERASLDYDESLALALIKAIKSVADSIQSEKNG